MKRGTKIAQRGGGGGGGEFPFGGIYVILSAMVQCSDRSTMTVRVTGPKQTYLQHGSA